MPSTSKAPSVRPSLSRMRGLGAKREQALQAIVIAKRVVSGPRAPQFPDSDYRDAPF